MLALLRTSLVLLILCKVHPDVAPAQLVAVEIPLRALRRGHVVILAEAEALLPASLPVRYNPAPFVHQLKSKLSPYSEPCFGLITHAYMIKTRTSGRYTCSTS